jgi:hypothetical protein
MVGTMKRYRADPTGLLRLTQEVGQSHGGRKPGLRPLGRESARLNALSAEHNLEIEVQVHPALSYEAVLAAI